MTAIARRVWRTIYDCQGRWAWEASIDPMGHSIVDMAATRRHSDGIDSMSAFGQESSKPSIVTELELTS
jgi:hypothetical protein